MRLREELSRHQTPFRLSGRKATSPKWRALYLSRASIAVHARSYAVSWRAKLLLFGTQSAIGIKDVRRIAVCRSLSFTRHRQARPGVSFSVALQNGFESVSTCRVTKFLFAVRLNIGNAEDIRETTAIKSIYIPRYLIVTQIFFIVYNQKILRNCIK